MTDALTTAAIEAATQQVISAATEHVASIDDLAERYQAARRVRAHLDEGNQALKEIQQAVAKDLKPGRTWAQVGQLLGVSGSRAEALAKDR